MLLFILLAAAPAAAQTSARTPAELQRAIKRAQPGDVIIMEDGRWTDADIRFEAQGAVGDSIYLRARTPGQVVLDGASRLRIGGQYLVVDGLRFEGGALEGGHVIAFRINEDSARQARHCRLTNSAVIDYNPPDTLTEYKWVSLYGTDNRVDHNYLAGKRHDGATMVVWLEPPPLDVPNRHRIDHNLFGARPPLGKNGAEAIRIGTSHRSMQDSETLVEYNLFERQDGEVEIISNKSGKNVYRGNTFVESTGSLTLRHGNGALVEGNYFFGNGKPESGGVRIIGEDHRVVGNYFEGLQGSNYYAALPIANGVPDSPLNRYFQVKNALVADNVFVGNRYTVVFGAGADGEKTLPPQNVSFRNNFFATDGPAPVITVVEEAEGTRWEGNVALAESLGIERPAGIEVRPPLVADEALREARARLRGGFHPLTRADVGPAWLGAAATTRVR